jgi:hypothetical protein
LQTKVAVVKLGPPVEGDALSPGCEGGKVWWGESVSITPFYGALDCELVKNIRE